MKSINLVHKLVPGFDLLFRRKLSDSAQPGLVFWTQTKQAVASWLTYESELQVWQETNPNGEDVWHAYDPVSDRTFCADSENEMRQWIEERYYITSA